jgi:Mn-dependent DtxR family transcriptional regulator
MSGIKKVLNSLATLQQSTGKEEHCKKRVGTMAQISNSTLPSLISRMTTNGLIAYGSSRGMIKLTKKGSDEADPVDVVGSDEEYHEKIKAELKGKSRAIFEYLADGKVHDKQDVMEAVDCTNPKTFNPLLSRELKKKGLIHYPEKGKIQLTDECFPVTRAFCDE